MTQMFKLGSSDVVKGVITAVLASLMIALAGVFNAPNFDILAADWGSIVHNMVNVAIAAGSGYVLKNFFSDSQGNFGGIRPQSSGK